MRIITKLANVKLCGYAILNRYQVFASQLPTVNCNMASSNKNKFVPICAHVM